MSSEFNTILRQFSPLERKPILRWLSESSHRRGLHPAYRYGLDASESLCASWELSRPSRIDYTLRHEFEGILSDNALAHLIQMVDSRLQKVLEKLPG